MNNYNNMNNMNNPNNNQNGGQNNPDNQNMNYNRNAVNNPNTRNGFLTFIFSFIPGAGQMYLGFLKRGVSIMGAFAAVTGISGFLDIRIFAVILPVLWFFSFFDTFNLKRRMRFEEIEDKWLFNVNKFSDKDWGKIIKSRHKLFGGVCIFAGIYIIIKLMLDDWLGAFSNYIPDVVWKVIYKFVDTLPTLIVSVLIIWLGFKLLHIGGKAENEDYVEYKGLKDNNGDKSGSEEN